MKNIKTAVFVALAMVALGMLFSFKNEQAVKEIGTIQFAETSKKDAITVHMGDEIRSISTLEYHDEKKFLTVLNQYVGEGWTIISTDYTSTGAFTNRVVYLERVKKN